MGTAAVEKYPNIEAMKRRFHLELITDAAPGVQPIICLGSRSRMIVPWQTNMEDLEAACKWALPVWSETPDPPRAREALTPKQVAAKFLEILARGPFRSRDLARQAGVELGEREREIIRILFRAKRVCVVRTKDGKKLARV